MSDSTTFSRLLLAQIMPEVKKMTSVAERKAAWVYHFMHDHWEFHGPDDYYWQGSAGDAYEARYNGWSAWLEHLAQEAKTLRAKENGKKARARQRGV